MKLIKTSFLWHLLLSNVESELIYFIQLVSQHQIVSRDFKSSNRNVTGV